jgi:hypothetical protein
MKNLLLIGALLGFSVAALPAQTIDTTVCEVLKNPTSFNGKTVRIKATVAAGFDQFVLRDASCGAALNAIWLSYPEGTKAKAGPALLLQLQPASNFAGTADAAWPAAPALEKSKDFKQFDSLLSAPYKGSGLCIGCNKNEVTATLVGRLDGVTPGIKRNAKGQITEIHGFGNLNMYSARLVLQSVSDVAARSIDYSKSAAVTNGETVPEATVADPIAAAHKAATAFSSSNPSVAARIERGAAAFGKQGENNGVEVNFGNGNEAAAAKEAKSSKSSPDGVLYNCTFDMGRLKGAALAVAITFAGSEVADLRDPQAQNPNAHDLQLTAWETATLTAVAQGLKTLTVPGGSLLWNAAWSPADRDKHVNDGLTSYFQNVEMFR